jgi:hypothetical protein
LLIGQIVSQSAEKASFAGAFSIVDQALNRAASPNDSPVCFELCRKSPVRQVNAPATPALPPSMAVGQLQQGAS